MSNWAFILFAYGLSWTVIAGYTVYLRARTRQARLTLESARGQREVAR